ncbi:CPXCG motif-containing cysteine-rich protein [Bdellovibrio sp. BCCA]|uniref:CPXCG motif-containing cysteine-rich protein n=1 Tax=Bdellovibrio sp. BCCA TaxID=3136281 RepID=UPI0030F0BA3B
MEYKVQCPFCREKFGITIHLEDGADQEFIWDCEVCCHPIDIHAIWNESHHKFSLRVGRGAGYDEMPI